MHGGLPRNRRRVRNSCISPAGEPPGHHDMLRLLYLTIVVARAWPCCSDIVVDVGGALAFPWYLFTRPPCQLSPGPIAMLVYVTSFYSCLCWLETLASTPPRWSKALTGWLQASTDTHEGDRELHEKGLFMRLPRSIASKCKCGASYLFCKPFQTTFHALCIFNAVPMSHTKKDLELRLGRRSPATTSKSAGCVRDGQSAKQLTCLQSTPGPRAARPDPPVQRRTAAGR